MLTKDEMDRQKKEQESIDRYYSSLLFYDSVDGCEVHLTADGWVRIMTDPYEGNVMITRETFEGLYKSLEKLRLVIKKDFF